MPCVVVLLFGKGSKVLKEDAQNEAGMRSGRCLLSMI